MKHSLIIAIAITASFTGCHQYPRTGLVPEASDPAIWRRAIQQADSQITGSGIDYRVNHKERSHGIVP